MVLAASMLTGIAPEAIAAKPKEKVVESSSRKKPDWIGRSDKTHFAVTEQAPTLSAAMDECLASIRQHIVNSVAVNIASTERMRTRQLTEGELVSVMNEYSSDMTARAAELPYINNITLSNAEQTYWEKILDKNNGTYRYEYSVLYPFSEEMRAELVGAFVAIDEGKQAELDNLNRQVNRLVNVDDIGAALIELDGLGEYFFDATRRNEVETLKRSYRALYGKIAIAIESEEAGRCVYSLMIDGRRVTTSQKPRLVSESALEMRVQEGAGGRYVLTYDPQYASPVELNTIDIMYLWGGARVAQTIYFKPE